MDKDRLQYHINQKKSTRLIAKEENCSPTRINYWLKKHNLVLFRKKRNYTDENIIQYSKETQSMGQLLKKLGLKPQGGNYHSIKNRLQKLNVDTSHWNKYGWNKNQQLKDWSSYSTMASLRKNLILERGNCCEKCNLSEWFGVSLTIEMHHIDGDRTNNNKNNLQLLCPNCHSITDTFKGKNIKRTAENIISSPLMKEKDVSLIKKAKKTKIVWPTKEKLEKLLWELPTTTISKNLGVSDTAISKYAKKLGLTKPNRGYWAKLNN